MSKPGIVIIHGAWHCGAHFASLRSALESHGYEVLTPSLPSVGAEPALMSFDPDVATTRSAVEGLLNAGKDVVVVGHSYGGMVITQALEGLGKKQRAEKNGPKSTGVIALLYITASFPLVGQSARMMTTEGINNLGPDDLYNMDMENLTLTVNDPLGQFYHDVPQPVADHAVSLLKHQSIMAFESPVTYAAYLDIPTTFLFCENDVVLPLAKQKQVVDWAREKAGATVHTESVKTGHSPWLVEEGYVERLIRRVAGEDGV